MSIQKYLRPMFVVLGLGATASYAADPHLIGLTGDLTGPSAGLYKPLAEGVRIYVESVNAAGGVNGSQIKLISRDNRGDPNQLVSDLTFFESEKVSAVILVSPSGTLGAFSRQNQKAQIPTIYVNACYPPAVPPKPDPNFFCPGIGVVADANAMIEKVKNHVGERKVRVGLITTDIPGARGVAEKLFKPKAESLGMEVVQIAVLPVDSSDATGVARDFMDKKIDVAISYTITKHMLAGAEALLSLGWRGEYFLTTALPGTFEQLRNFKAENIYGFDQFSIINENKPVHQAIRAAASRHGFGFPIDEARMGYRAGMVLGQALKNCATPCTRDLLRASLTNLTVDDEAMRDLNLGPVVFSSSVHTSPTKTFRLYHWSNRAGAVVPVGKDLTVKEMDWN